MQTFSFNPNSHSHSQEVTLNKSRYLNLLVLTTLIITSIISIQIQPVKAQDYGLIAVLIEDNVVLGFHWPITLITLTIDDLATPGLDYSAQAMSQIDPNQPEDTFVSFKLGVAFQIRPGHIVTMSDGIVKNSHVVTSLTLDGADLIGDRLWGTADPGSIVELVHQSQRDIIRNEMADAAGNWEADFSEPGDDLPLEERTHDFALGTIFMVMQSNGGGHTQIDWQMPTPQIQVSKNDNLIIGSLWPLELPITITIDDPSNGSGTDYSATVPWVQCGWEEPREGCVRFELGEDFLVQTGHIVTMSDGVVLTKTLVVTDPEVTFIDPTSDIVTGRATPGSRLTVEIWYLGLQCSFELYIDESGSWIADMSGICDIVPASWVVAREWDDDLDSTSFGLRILNTSPQIDAIIAPTSPNSVNTPIMVSANFIDPDLGDIHTAEWDWGDGSGSAGSIDEDIDVASGIHTYTEPGVYALHLMLCDSADACDIAEYQYVVVYDPNVGSVTGGGWIMSPTGAYVPDPDLTGKATFGFVSKYKKGAEVPEGNAEFQFKTGDLNFHSTQYKWLIVTGSNYAKFMGKGTINGDGINGEDYKFQIWTGDSTGPNGEDTFRVKIWWEDVLGEHVVYDNGMDQAIGGGSIVIHK